MKYGDRLGVYWTGVFSGPRDLILAKPGPWTSPTDQLERFTWAIETWRSPHEVVARCALILWINGVGWCEAPPALRTETYFKGDDTVLDVKCCTLYGLPAGAIVYRAMLLDPQRRQIGRLSQEDEVYAEEGDAVDFTYRLSSWEGDMDIERSTRRQGS